MKGIKVYIFNPFTAVLSLVLALFAVNCDFYPDNSRQDEDFKPYDFDENNRLRGVTLRLDDSSASSAKNSAKFVSRALSNAAAKASFDFLEVVFYAKTDAGDEIIRANWGVGQYGFISGVTRGIDYGSADPDIVDNDNGAAVLFIGNKNTGNLLAVGLISHVDGQPDNTVIEDTSKTVTFTIHSLEAGVFADSIANLIPFNIRYDNSDPAGVTFSALELDADTSVQTGNYTFKFSNLDAANPAHEEAIANRFAGIRAGTDDPAFIFESPKFILHGIEEEITDYTSILDLTGNFILAQGSALAGADGKVPYMFNIVSGEGLTSFYYSIPVYAISHITGTDNSEAFSWRIRPGPYTLDELSDSDGYPVTSGVSLEFLDDGTASAVGGTILLIIGDNADNPYELY